MIVIQEMYLFLPQGHDAWVIGKVPVVVIDFKGMLDYAKGIEAKGDENQL